MVGAGAELVDELARRGHVVTAFSRRAGGDDPRIVYQSGDVLDADAVAKAELADGRRTVLFIGTSLTAGLGITRPLVVTDAGIVAAGLIDRVASGAPALRSSRTRAGC